MSNLIDRQAAIDVLNEYFARIGKLKRRGLTKGEKAISLDTVGAIKTLPPAQRKGKWLEKKVIPLYENGFPLQSCKCSECGIYDIRPYMYYFSEPNFCSYCSADMRQDDPSHPFTDDVMMKGEEDENNNQI